MKRHLPNFLTLGRLLLVPPIVVLLFFPGRFPSLLAAILFFIASLTDFFDGFIARRLKVESSFGRFLDPIADKVLVTSALIMLIALDRVDAWIVMLIISREVAVSASEGDIQVMGFDTKAQPYREMESVFSVCRCYPTNGSLRVSFHRGYRFQSRSGQSCFTLLLRSPCGPAWIIL